MDPLKIILVGNSGCGKTTLFNCFLNKPDHKREKPTISPSCMKVDIQTEKGDILTVEIWDTAGQEQYYALSQMFYRDADVALVCYTMDDKDSIQKWIDRVHQIVPNCIIILTETKSDLLNYDQEYEEKTDGFDLKTKYQAMAHYLTSGYSGTNVTEVFVDSAKIFSIVHKKLNNTSLQQSQKTPCC